MRALALPDLVDAVGKGGLPLDPDLQSIAKSRKDERWIDLLTGHATLIGALAESLVDIAVSLDL